MMDVVDPEEKEVLDMVRMLSAYEGKIPRALFDDTWNRALPMIKRHPRLGRTIETFAMVEAGVDDGHRTVIESLLRSAK